MTTNTNLLDLDTETTNAEYSEYEVIPSEELADAEEQIINLNLEPEAEVYNVVDLYPEVELPASTLTAISADESLWEIQQKIDYLTAELEAAQNSLNNQIMSLQNKAKEELIASQRAADEALVLNALEQPEMMSILASVLRIMQQNGKAGILLEALDNIENGNPTNAMQRLATTIVEPSPVYATQEWEPVNEEAPVVEPIKTSPAPGKWKP